MKESTVIRLAQALMYIVMFSILLAMLHNVWYNKHLNVTTPCFSEEQGEITPRPIWEILGYADGPQDVTQVQQRPEVDEWERLMQSCLSWQHNYNFINYRIMPAIALLLVAFLMKQNPRFFAKLPERIKKTIRESDNEGNGKKPPTFGFGKK